MKKKLILGGVLLIALGIVIVTINERSKYKENKELKLAAEQILEREKEGELLTIPRGREDAGRDQDGILALIDLGKYSDAERIIKKCLKLSPKGVAWIEYYADLLEKQKKWDKLAEIVLNFYYDNFGIANVTNTDYLCYTRLKAVEEKVSEETRKKVNAFFDEVEANEKKYQQLQSYLNNKNIKKAKSIVKQLLEADADNEEFFGLYMEYLIIADKKQEGRKYLEAYKERRNKDDITLAYFISAKDIRSWEEMVE